MKIERMKIEWFSSLLFSFPLSFFNMEKDLADVLKRIDPLAICRQRMRI